MIPDWKLERYRLGELDATERAEIAAELQGDAGLRARVDSLDADDASTLAAHPARRVAASIHERRAARAPATALRWALPAMALAAALIAGVVVPRVTTPGDEVRLKGDGPALRVFRQLGAGTERLSDGATVKARDLVQVAFDAAGAKHLVVVSVDGAGHPTVHWPLDGDSRRPPELKALPEAFELDDAPGFERFFLVTSGEPLNIHQVMAAAVAAGRSGPLTLPSTATQRSLLLQKASP